MDRLLRRLLPCLLLLALSSPASAVFLSAGEQHVFNFDFASAAPPPPFGLVTVETDFVRGSAHGNTVAIDWFGGLDASGAPLGGSGAFAVEPFFLTVVEDFALPDMLDGVFSIRVSALEGAISVDSSARVCASGCAGLPDGGVAPVPAPGSLTLLIAALLACRASAPRRRHRGSSPVR